MHRISLRSIFFFVAVTALVICSRHQLIHFLMFDLAGLFFAFGMLALSIVAPVHSVHVSKPIAWTTAFAFVLISIGAVWCLMRCFAFADMAYPLEFPHPDWFVDSTQHLVRRIDNQPNRLALDVTATLFLIATLLSWLTVCFFVRAGLNRQITE